MALRTSDVTERYNGPGYERPDRDRGERPCWCTVLIVWLAGALYNARHAPRERIRTESRQVTLAVATFLACSVVLFFGRGVVQSLVVDAAWVRFLGVAVLIVSTAFALWARFSLGTSWSMAPEVGGDRRLRIQGRTR